MVVAIIGAFTALMPLVLALDVDEQQRARTSISEGSTSPKSAFFAGTRRPPWRATSMRKRVVNGMSAS